MSRGFKSIDDLDVRGKRVLVRADLNVPVKNGRVTDSTRIDRTALTLKELLGRGARVVLLAHFGRPDGKRVPEMSLRPVLEPLSKALGGKPVAFAEDCVGEPARKAVAALKDGEIALLENLRYHAAEEKNDPLFAASWPLSAISMSTTRSPALIAPMPRPRRSRGCCPTPPAG